MNVESKTPGCPERADRIVRAIRGKLPGVAFRVDRAAISVWVSDPRSLADVRRVLDEGGYGDVNAWSGSPSRL